MDGSLSGAHVQHVSVGLVDLREVVLLELRVPGATVHLVVAGGFGIGALEGDPHRRLRRMLREARSPTQSRWRAALEGAQLVFVGRDALRFERDGRSLVAVVAGRSLRLDKSLPEQASMGTAHPRRDPQAIETLEWDTLQRQGPELLHALERAAVDRRRDALRRALAKATARIERRIEAIRGDLDRMRLAEAAAATAQLFVAEAARSPRGTTLLRAPDWSLTGPDGKPQIVELEIEASKSPKEQIEARFRRAGRLKQGATAARARLDAAVRTRDALANIGAALARLDAAVGTSAAPPDHGCEVLEGLENAAGNEGGRDFKLAAAPSPTHRGPADSLGAAHAQARLPHKTFLGASGALILVGRGASDNDALTTRVARPHDLWLHARSQSGAHVVVPLRKGSSCPADVLVQAAHLAAYFSDARGQPVVEIQYTPRRYVRKRRGSAPGAVVVEREKIILVRMDELLLRALLQREVQP